MKKIVSLLMLLVAFVSCESDVKFNDPSFQGQKDNFLWRADRTVSLIGNGNLGLNAFRGSEQVSLIIPAPFAAIDRTNPVVYNLGENDQIVASYQHTEEGSTMVYTTGDGIGNGQIIINHYDPTTKKVSGSFRFNAIYTGSNPNVPVNVNFQDGFIYNIQVQ